MTAVLSPRVWLAGVPLLVAAFAYSPSPILILIAVLALPQLMKAWTYDASAPENQRYYGVSASTKIEYAAIYLLLAAALGIMTYSVHQQLGG